jgi:hypothetical protein
LQPRAQQKEENKVADLNQLADVITKYAKSTHHFITPNQLSDPIQPAPSSLQPDQFNQFFFDLLNCLTDAGVSANVPMEGLKACRTWRDVVVLVFHFEN